MRIGNGALWAAFSEAMATQESEGAFCVGGLARHGEAKSK